MTSKTPFFVLFFCFLCGCCESHSHLDLPEHVHGAVSDAAQQLHPHLDLDISLVVKSTVPIIRNVISIMSKHGTRFGESRLGRAIADCVELMDATVDQLGWTLYRNRHLNGKANATGYVMADMKTWLSAALANQETCRQGFELEDTDIVIKKLIESRVNKISSFILEILTNVKAIHDRSIAAAAAGSGEVSGDAGTRADGSCKSFVGNGGGESGGKKKILPEWLKSEDLQKIESATWSTANAVVAADGSGDYTKIQEAVNAVPECSAQRYVIYVKKGVYNEYIEISKRKLNVMLISDGIDATVITGNRSYVDGWTTFRSATFAVRGEGFIARGITFENTAGPEKHQAVAFRSDSDLSVLYKCAFRGYQDTLYAHAQRQFYKDCVITGTIDFIFGDAAAVFQDCQILARKPLPGQKNIVTAQGRKEAAESTGFSIQFCNISAEAEVLAAMDTVETYLGRPWKEYSRTVIMESYIGNVIRPEGWLEWSGTFALDTLFYAEYKNQGPGAAVDRRVKWPGYHVLTSKEQADAYSVKYFIVGLAWLPATGVEFTASLHRLFSGSG